MNSICKAETLRRLQEVREFIAQGWRRPQIVEECNKRYNIKPSAVDKYIARVHRELEKFYQLENDKRYLEDLEWMYRQRDNATNPSLSLAFHKEINEVLGRKKKSLDITSANEKIQVVISSELSQGFKGK